MIAWRALRRRKRELSKKIQPVLVGWLSSATFEVIRLIAEARRAPFHTVQGPCAKRMAKH